MKEILANLDSEGGRLTEEVDDMMHLGKYIEGRHRPIKLKLKSQAAAEWILSRSWLPSGTEEYKQTFIRRNMNIEERDKLRGNVSEVKQRNGDRTEEEKKFFWKIKNESEEMVDQGRK